MCYIITSEYIKCSHETRTFHECAPDVARHHPEKGMWKRDDVEHEMLRINRTKLGLCPACSGKEEIAFRFPDSTPAVADMPDLLIPGQALFQRTCDIAYAACTRNEPIGATTDYRIIDAALDQAIAEDREMLRKSRIDPLPQSHRESLYPSIGRELRIKADRRHSHKDADPQRADARHPIPDAQLSKLARDLKAKNPCITGRETQRILALALAHVAAATATTASRAAEHLLRSAAFEATTCFPFPAALHASRRAQADAIVELVRRDPRSRHFRAIPEATLRGLIDASQVHAWTCRPRPPPSRERDVFLAEVGARLERWARGALGEDGREQADREPFLCGTSRSRLCPSVGSRLAKLTLEIP